MCGSQRSKGREDDKILSENSDHMVSESVGLTGKICHWNEAFCFLQLKFIHKQRRTQWVYERTIPRSNKFIQIPVPTCDFFEMNANKSVCPDYMGARFATIFA